MKFLVSPIPKCNEVMCFVHFIRDFQKFYTIPIMNPLKPTIVAQYLSILCMPLTT